MREAPWFVVTAFRRSRRPGPAEAGHYKRLGREGFLSTIMTAPTHFTIAVLPGDGIGVDVTAEAVKVLRAAERASGRFTLELHEHECGAGCYLRTGDDLPTDTIDACRAA